MCVMCAYYDIGRVGNHPLSVLIAYIDLRIADLRLSAHAEQHFHALFVISDGP